MANAAFPGSMAWPMQFDGPAGAKLPQIVAGGWESAGFGVPEKRRLRRARTPAAARVEYDATIAAATMPQAAYRNDDRPSAKCTPSLLMTMR